MLPLVGYATQNHFWQTEESMSGLSIFFYAELAPMKLNETDRHREAHARKVRGPVCKEAAIGEKG